MRKRRTFAAIVVASLVAAVTPAALAQRDSAQAREQTDRTDHRDGLRASEFVLEVEGFEEAFRFSELVAISWEAEGPRPGEIVLKRGLTDDTRLLEWLEAVRSDPSTARKDVSVIIYDSAGAEVKRWNFINAWPSKREIATLKAGDTSALKETVQITCEFIQRVSA